MQTASSDFTAAAQRYALTRTPVRVEADWAQDGYGGPGTIDDLSPVVGDVTVTHQLDDGWPDDVTQSNQATSAGVSADLLAGLDGTRASRYFSPFNTDSPVVDYERDVAPVRVRSGVITDVGPEEVTIFTGQMTNTPVGSGTAVLQTMSSTLLKLKKLVQPPAVRSFFEGRAAHGGRRRGVNATWPVSWALTECGLYASPPPRAGCRYWVPMHGSTAPFLPATNDVNGNWNPRLGGIRFAPPEAAEYPQPAFVPGPFVLGADGGITTAEGLWGITGIPTLQVGDGDDFLSQAGNIGRVEFYVRHDSNDPGAVGWVDGMARFTHETGVGSSNVDVLFLATGRMQILLDDGATQHAYTSTALVPDDGQWYRVGAAWNVAGNRLWTFVNGTVEQNTPSPAMSTAALPATEDLHEEAALISWTSVLPVAELQVTTGSTANPAVEPDWIGEGFTPTAVVWPSTIELEALVEPKPREAMELIASFARSELAVTWIDELDRFHYLPRGYWVQDDQQVVTDTLSGDAEIGKLNIVLDPSTIRTAITATYNETRIEEPFSHVLEVFTTFQLPRGVTVLKFGLDAPIVSAVGSLSNLTAGQVATGGSPIAGFVTINNSVLGTGAYATAAQVRAEIIEWTPGSITVQFTNVTPWTWYLLNETAALDTGTVPFLAVSGNVVRQTQNSITLRDETMIALRGERGLSVDFPMIQREYDARQVADNLLTELRRPVPVASDVELFGDPRRQPGDLVTVDDSGDTMLSGNYRTDRMTHVIDGADYRQSTRLRREMPLFIVGTSKVGEAKVTP